VLRESGLIRQRNGGRPVYLLRSFSTAHSWPEPERRPGKENPTGYTFENDSGHTARTCSAGTEQWARSREAVRTPPFQ
jgi:hypothetical protein